MKPYFRQNFAALIPALAVGFVTLLSPYITAAQGTDKTTIGAFIEGSTVDPSVTEAFKRGIQLALEKFDATDIDIRYLPADQGRDPESPSLKSLVESARSPALLYWSVDDITPVARFLDQSGTVGLVTYDVTKRVSSLGRQVFGFGYSTESSFQELAKFAGKNLKSYRFGLISSPGTRFDFQVKAFSEQTKSLGNTVVFDEKVTSGDTFKDLIARAQKEKCDTLFAALPATDLVNFVTAAREGGFKGHILVGDTLFEADLAKLREHGEGIHMVQAWSDDADLRNRYTTKFNTPADGVTLGVAALGHDTVSCLLGTGRPLSASLIRPSLLSTPCEGLTGKTGFSGQRIAQRKKKILVVKGGQFTSAE